MQVDYSCKNWNSTFFLLLQWKQYKKTYVFVFLNICIYGSTFILGIGMDTKFFCCGARTTKGVVLEVRLFWKSILKGCVLNVGNYPFKMSTADFLIKHTAPTDIFDITIYLTTFYLIILQKHLFGFPPVLPYGLISWPYLKLQLCWYWVHWPGWRPTQIQKIALNIEHALIDSNCIWVVIYI